MAPVGSRESLAAAIQAGADSIYFGIENLNMRARSANTFTIEDLREIARTCDEHGMKSYLTVNTIIYDKDIELMRTIVDAAKEAGISAVIAADVAVMSYANKIGQEVHLSTQLNISNAEALKFYAQFADVVVLARELNLEQVAEIYRQIQEEHICGPSGELIRIEMFCHGALCMAVSGKCYLSLHEMNHSANRGACMQICRRAYTVRDKDTDVELEVDNQYIMSPKDLKTIHFMNKMIDAGVRVFKIEGRARGPEYVRTVVECYKQAIRAYLDDSFTDEKIAAWDERLKTVFNRGFWDGYYLGQRLGEWTKNYGSAATERKIYVGKGIKYFSNIGVAEYKKGKTILPDWATWECYRTDVTGVGCYSSKDLLNWKFEGIVLPAVKDDPNHDLHPSKVLERPKVVYNKKTGKFVMWAHVESADYSKACAGVAVSDSPVGPFVYQGSFRPNNAMSRDQTVFVDDDGRAYQFYSSENNETMYISLLTDDYLKPSGRFTRNFVKESREAPAVFKYNGKYYMLSSGCTGWDPNIAEIAVADSIMGTWKTIGNPCTGPDADKTFYAQSTYVQPVASC